MTDWMVEVCTSFKCSTRTYFLSTQVFDHYLTLIRSKGKMLINKDVHALGVTSMYLASKYEDIYPLHSKVVAEKIAHKAISAKEVLKKEQIFLGMFEYDIDFVTHYDFHQTYADKIKYHLHRSKSFKPSYEKYMKLIRDMAMVLVKMSMQNIDFTHHSLSIIVMACYFAAITMFKSCKKHEGPDQATFCFEINKILTNLIKADR